MRCIKIYGDSILKGVIYNETLKKYRLFGYKYEELEKRGYCVENNCKMGATIEKGLEIIKATLGDDEDGNLVVMEFGGNDCNFDWAEVARDPEGRSHLPLTPEDRFVEKYAEAVDYAKKRGALVKICTLVPIESKRFFNWVSRGLSKENILKYIGDVNAIGRWQEYYSRLAERVAEKTGSEIVDLRSAFLQPNTLDRMICIDGIHPNAEGYERLSRVFQKNVVSDCQ